MRAINGARRSGRGAAFAMGACACVLALGLSGCVFTTPSRAEVEPERIEATLTSSDLVNEGVLTVAMDTTDAPQAMTDVDGAPSGYYADVARALAEHLGLDLKVVSSASPAKVFEEGEADIYLGSKLSDADEDLVVTDAIVNDASSVFTRTEDGSNEVPALDADALAGKVVAVQGDSASRDALVRGGVDASLKEYPNVNECFEALASGTVDYVACDATAGAYLARAYPGAVFVATVGSLSTYGVALPTEGTDLSRAIEDALDELQNDGTLEAIYRQWYGALPFDLSGERLSGLTTSSNDEEDADEPTSAEESTGADDSASTSDSASTDDPSGAVSVTQGQDVSADSASVTQEDSDLTFSGDINAID